MSWLMSLGTFVIGLILTFGFAIGTRLAPSSSVIEIACCIMTFITMTATVVGSVIFGIIAADDADHKRRY